MKSDLILVTTKKYIKYWVAGLQNNFNNYFFSSNNDWLHAPKIQPRSQGFSISKGKFLGMRLPQIWLFHDPNPEEKS